MTVQRWSENILLADLQDDPAFSDDVSSLSDQVAADPNLDVILDFAQITYLNSSNIAKLLKLRKTICVNNRHKLRLCGVSTHVWGVFLVTGLEKVFEFADNVAMGLTGVQIEE